MSFHQLQSPTRPQEATSGAVSTAIDSLRPLRKYTCSCYTLLNVVTRSIDKPYHVAFTVDTTRRALIRSDALFCYVFEEIIKMKCPVFAWKRCMTTIFRSFGGG